jgi:hypothetical protein
VRECVREYVRVRVCAPTYLYTLSHHRMCHVLMLACSMHIPLCMYTHIHVCMLTHVCIHISSPPPTSQDLCVNCMCVSWRAATTQICSGRGRANYAGGGVSRKLTNVAHARRDGFRGGSQEDLL